MKIQTVRRSWDINQFVSFIGVEYGNIFAYMKRPISERYITDIKKPHVGTIEINE